MSMKEILLLAERDVLVKVYPLSTEAVSSDRSLSSAATSGIIILKERFEYHAFRISLILWITANLEPFLFYDIHALCY